MDTTSTATLPNHPTLGLMDGGLTHAARPAAPITAGGFAPAMCRSTLYVSVEYALRSVRVDGQLVWRNDPVHATADPMPTLDDAGNVIGEGVDCLRCAAALERYEARRAAEMDDA